MYFLFAMFILKICQKDENIEFLILNGLLTLKPKKQRVWSTNGMK